MYSINIKEFQDFIYASVKRVIDSNNDLDTLNDVEKKYQEIKPKVNPEEIKEMKGDHVALDTRFEKILKLGFERVEERKLKNDYIPF